MNNINQAKGLESRFSFGTLNSNASSSQLADSSDSPFRIVIMGDFSGRQNHGSVESIAGRDLVRVDVDNQSAVMRRLGVSLNLPCAAGQPESFAFLFDAPDAFHPDRLLQQAPVLTRLMDLRKRLQNPATSTMAATEFQSLFQRTPIAPAPAPTPAVANNCITQETAEDSLQRLLGKSSASPGVPQPKPSAGVNIDRLIRNIVAPSITHPIGLEQKAMIGEVESELARSLNFLLRHPDFQALEAAWRGVDFLLRRLGEEENIHFYLLDVSLQELSIDLNLSNDLNYSGLFQRLRDQKWGMIVGNYFMDASVGHIQTLGRLAKVAAELQTPLVAGAKPSLAGCDGFDIHPDPVDWTCALPPESQEAWSAVRKLPESRYIGLAVPRFLIRHPYGRKSEPLDSFPFEEQPELAGHETFLWANSAFLCALIAGMSFQVQGWDIEPPSINPVDGLPVYCFEVNGETVGMPCAEAWLGERAGNHLMSLGMIPVLSVRGRDVVRLADLQSISDPSRRLF